MAAVVGLSLAVAPPAGAATGHRKLVVSTDKGRVRGAVAYGVESFLGIPYAAPPVGALRWQPPRPMASWTGIRSAAKYGSECPQNAGLDSPKRGLNENCLFVNVQRPLGTKSTAKLPVYVYIHGGGFLTGSGENLNKIVNETGVIGVSLNYRLGALGFLSLPGLTKQQGQSGNYGLLDQQAALKWVQRNIARFGGDPRRVTLGGESAGGWSVCYHLVSPGSRGTFAQAMIQSGGCPAQTQRQAETSGVALAAKVGCTDSATAVACMRTKPVGTLLDSVTGNPFAVYGTAFLPTDPQKAVTTGHFARVPIVVGGQRDEARSFYQAMIGWTKAQYVAWVQATFPDTADAVLAHYPWPAKANRFTPAYLVSAIVTDSGMLVGIGGKGTRSLTRRLARYVPTYSYEFDHRTGPGWTDIPGYVWGAGHATELNYLFPRHGITTESEYHKFGPAEKRLARQMVQYWGAFVKTGHPRVQGQLAWPRYRVDGAGLLLSLRAGADGKTTVITDRAYRAEHQVNFWKAIG